LKQTVKKILSRISPRLSFASQVYRYTRSSSSYYVKTGYLRSMTEGKPVDKDGSPIPWMNYCIVKFLKERLNKNMSLFEYGSGFSTRFYAQNVKSVVSVEHDKKWFAMLKEDTPANCKALYAEYNQELMGGEYSQTVKKLNEKFDIIVVDGRDRVNCVNNSINALTQEGVIILDDSSRERYGKAFDLMHSVGFKSLTFCGLKFGGGKESCTTIFYRDGNCLEI
jgi:precorrin-6B methylase 2